MMYEVENKMVVDWCWRSFEHYADEDRLLSDLYPLDEDDMEMLEAEADMVDDDVLEELVENKTGIHPENVRWNAWLEAIDFEYKEVA